MKRAFSLVLAVQLVFSPFVLAQAQEKPVAALGRVATLGEVFEGQREIIANRLRTILSKSYDLISQHQHEKAEQGASDALELEK